MHLTRSVDIEAACDAVYALLTDVDHWERAALRRGADVQRRDPRPGAFPGLSWDTAFTFRGKRREVRVTIDRLDPGKSVHLDATGAAFQVRTVIDLAAMAPRRTRMTVSVDAAPRTLTARLLLQSLRLAQGRIGQKFDRQLAALAQDIETRLRPSPARGRAADRPGG